MRSNGNLCGQNPVLYWTGFFYGFVIICYKNGKL